MDDLLIEIAEENILIELNEKGERGLGYLPMVVVSDDAILTVGVAHKVTDLDEAILALPPANIGDPIEVFGYGLGGWRIPIPIGKVINILGGGGSVFSDDPEDLNYLKSNSQFSMARLRCIVQNTEWVAEIYDCSTK